MLKFRLKNRRRIRCVKKEGLPYRTIYNAQIVGIHCTFAQNFLELICIVLKFAPPISLSCLFLLLLCSSLSFLSWGDSGLSSLMIYLSPIHYSLSGKEAVFISSSTPVALNMMRRMINKRSLKLHAYLFYVFLFQEGLTAEEIARKEPEESKHLQVSSCYSLICIDDCHMCNR